MLRRGRGCRVTFSEGQGQGNSAIDGATTRDMQTNRTNPWGLDTIELALANMTLNLQALANSRKHLSIPLPDINQHTASCGVNPSADCISTLRTRIKLATRAAFRSIVCSSSSIGLVQMMVPPTDAEKDCLDENRLHNWASGVSLLALLQGFESRGPGPACRVTQRLGFEGLALNLVPRSCHRRRHTSL